MSGFEGMAAAFHDAGTRDHHERQVIPDAQTADRDVDGRRHRGALRLPRTVTGPLTRIPTIALPL
jgi:hypothetical protein